MKIYAILIAFYSDNRHWFNINFGQQQLSFFHGYYEEHMYHLLFIFDGHSGFPLAAVLHPGNTHASHRPLAVLKRLIKKLKKAYPGALILFRADAGFAVPALYRYLEQQEVRYVIGFITNNRVLTQAVSMNIDSIFIPKNRLNL
jgi:hypothetical protein